MFRINTICFLTIVICLINCNKDVSGQLHSVKSDENQPKDIRFEDSGQKLGKSNSWYVALVDLNNDGYPDAYFDDKIWLNNGKGVFTETQTSFGEGPAIFADLNSDDRIDAVIKNEIRLNDGSGNLNTISQSLGGSDISSFVMDCNDDGYKDIISLSPDSDSLWLNNGKGYFENSGISFGGWAQAGYAVADFDGDSDTDVFVTMPHNPPPPPFNALPDFILFKEDGKYVKGNQKFTAKTSRGVAAGDVDNDGDQDLIIGNQDGPVQLWLNNGNANFTLAQDLSQTCTWPYLIDLNNDGDQDAVIIRGGPMDNGKPNEVWENRGGKFIDTGIQLGNANTVTAAFADIDGDGDIDIITANLDLNNNGATNMVYVNLINE